MHYAAFCIVVWPIFRERVASPAVYRQLFAILLVAQLRKPLAKPSCPGSAAVCNSTSGPTERFACKTQLSLDRQLFAILLVAQLIDPLAKSSCLSAAVCNSASDPARRAACSPRQLFLLHQQARCNHLTAVCTLAYFLGHSLGQNLHAFKKKNLVIDITRT